MTEKRFQYNVNKNSIEYDGKHFAYCNWEQSKIAKKLNGLTAKNKVLCKEIERLKRQNKDLLYSNAKNMELLEKENEQLKSIIKEVIELLSEEVDVFSDKATEHDINAYIELKELDNKDAYYMATATKKAIKLLKGVVDD